MKIYRPDPKLKAKPGIRITEFAAGTGGSLLAGPPEGPAWTLVWRNRAETTDGKRGLWTNNLVTCAAVVYAYAPGGSIKQVTLHHANAGHAESVTSITQAGLNAGVIKQSNKHDVHVVFAFPGEDLETYMDDIRWLNTGLGIPDEQIGVYCMHDDYSSTFGITPYGYVGICQGPKRKPDEAHILLDDKPEPGRKKPVKCTIL